MAGTGILRDQPDDTAALRSRSERFGKQSDIDMTPMIDMTCLLLVFFMLTSTFSSQKDLEVPAAEHGIGVETATATFITIRQPQEPGGATTILLGDAAGEAGDVDGVRRRVEEGLAAGRRQVVIKAEGRVPYRDVRQVAQAVSSVEGVTLNFGVRDKP